MSDVYQSAFDASPAAQAILNHLGQMVAVNQQACAWLAQSRDALLGKRLVDLVHVDDRPYLFKAILESAHALTSFELDCRVPMPDGAVRWFAVQARAVRQDDGQTIWYCVFVDITDRKGHDAWLTGRNALLTALSNNLPGMIYVYRAGPDVGGRLEFVSEGVREMFGISPEEAVSSPWAIYSRVEPEDLDRFFVQRDEANAASTRLHSEFRARNAQDEWRWYAADSVRGQDANGHEVRCGYIADITERRLYQEARVAAETAQRASQAKSEFLSRMSHELRTPLNAVIGFAQLMQMDRGQPLGPEQQHKAHLIERAGAHLLAVISDVLDLSRIEAGDMPLSVEPQSLASVLHDALAMVADQASRAEVQLLSPDLQLDVPVLADRVRLRQVLVNLLSNATKYNHPGGAVRVSAWQEDAAVVMSVSDTGRGLTPEQMAHLFEPFNRLGAEQTGIDGTGIGLVIVRRLVLLMGGEIKVDSVAGTGTTFTVRLPAADTFEPSQHSELDVVPAECRHATLLYAEDNEINVVLVQQILALRPMWTLQVARTGAEALHMVRQQRPDLLLLDMHLGDMTGFELVDLLEKNKATQGIPKVALSADAMPDRVHAARAKGFRAYLTKPLDVAELLRCLDEQLGA